MHLYHEIIANEVSQLRAASPNTRAYFILHSMCYVVVRASTLNKEIYAF